MMNIDRLKESGIAYEEGVERFSGSTALYEKYLKRLLGLTLYDEMKEEIRQGEIEKAFESAHKFKAFVGNLSMNHFFEEVRDLTERLRAGDTGDYTKDLERMDQEYARIIAAIREEA